MFLKRLKLTNYRKFSAEQNVVEFISSKIVKKQEDENAEETVTTEETKEVLKLKMQIEALKPEAKNSVPVKNQIYKIRKELRKLTNKVPSQH